MLKPNDFAASRSDRRPSSVGATYCPSGHQLWSSQPAAYVKLPLSRGRVTVTPEPLTEPRPNVRMPKYDRTESPLARVTVMLYRFGCSGDQSRRGAGMATASSAPLTPRAVVFAPSTITKNAAEPLVALTSRWRWVRLASVLSCRIC